VDAEPSGSGVVDTSGTSSFCKELVAGTSALLRRVSPLIGIDSGPVLEVCAWLD